MIKSLFVAGTLLWSTVAFSQVSKQKCICDHEGYFVIPTNLMKPYLKSGFSSLECSLPTIIKIASTELSDSMKIRFIESLLQFRNDTSKVCFASHKGQALGDTVNISREYTLQVYSLYLINWLMFYNYTRQLSPNPILFDCVKAAEINTDQNAVKKVFDLYIDWFGKAKANKFRKYTFPLTNTRFKWYGGKNLDILMNLPGNDVPNISN